MPIYEYKCRLCGHSFEQLQKFSDAPLTGCPKCGKDGLEKCVSLPTFKLKGDGWYETDFKRVKKPDEKKLEETNETEKTKKPVTPKKEIPKSTDKKEDKT